MLSGDGEGVFWSATNINVEGKIWIFIINLCSLLLLINCCAAHCPHPALSESSTLQPLVSNLPG